MSHVFKHPSYYKKLKASQEKKAISPDPATAGPGRAPSSKPQASGSKQQASSNKLLEVQVIHQDLSNLKLKK